MKFLIEGGAFPEEEKQLIQVLTDMKIEFSIWNKEGRPPYLSADNHVFFYGSIHTALDLMRVGARFQIWLGHEFDYSYFGAHLDDMLNDDFLLIPYGVINKAYAENQNPNIHNKMFFRSNSGYKKLQGGVYTATGLIGEANRVNLFKEDIIVAAEVNEIEAEYRLVIRSKYDDVTGLWANKVVTSSRYNDELDDSGIPQYAIAKIESDLDTCTYHPYPLWVLDVAQMYGKFYQLEANSINTSGLYNCNIKAIVEEVLKIEKEEIQ